MVAMTAAAAPLRSARRDTAGVLVDCGDAEHRGAMRTFAVVAAGTVTKACIIGTMAAVRPTEEKKEGDADRFISTELRRSI